jgi:hypothetical protein
VTVPPDGWLKIREALAAWNRGKARAPQGPGRGRGRSRPPAAAEPAPVSDPDPEEQAVALERGLEAMVTPPRTRQPNTAVVCEQP